MFSVENQGLEKGSTGGTKNKATLQTKTTGYPVQSKNVSICLAEMKSKQSDVPSDTPGNKTEPSTSSSSGFHTITCSQRSPLCFSVKLKQHYSAGSLGSFGYLGAVPSVVSSKHVPVAPCGVSNYIREWTRKSPVPSEPGSPPEEPRQGCKTIASPSKSPALQQML